MHATIDRPARSNKYASPCDTCGATVPAAAGTLTRENDRWVVRHQPGRCPVQRPAANWAQNPGALLSGGHAEQRRTDVQALLASVPGGRYALPSATGTNDLDFWVVTVNHGRVNPANKGRKWVKRFLGGQGAVEITRPQVEQASYRLAALTASERQAAAELFGREVGCCGRCGRSLTDEDSRRRGLGPECAGKAW